MEMTLAQFVKRTGLGNRTIRKYLYEGKIPSCFLRRVETRNKVQAWRIHEDAIPWVERILATNLENIHGCNPALWAVRKLESDRKRGLVE